MTLEADDPLGFALAFALVAVHVATVLAWVALLGTWLIGIDLAYPGVVRWVAEAGAGFFLLLVLGLVVDRWGR